MRNKFQLKNIKEVYYFDLSELLNVKLYVITYLRISCYNTPINDLRYLEIK